MGIRTGNKNCNNDGGENTNAITSIGDASNNVSKIFTNTQGAYEEYTVNVLTNVRTIIDNNNCSVITLPAFELL